MERLMSLRGYVRQLKPRTENYIPPVDRVQDLLEAAKGINIDVLQKEIPKSNILRATVLFDAIKNQTKLETTKGSVTLNWISDADRIAAEIGDYSSAFESRPSRYKPAFVTDAGDNIKLNDILKTAAFVNLQIMCHVLNRLRDRDKTCEARIRV